MKIKNEYDVIVVGAGPAGTSTAKSCAEQGLTVLVLDRNLEIGTPVRCGEGLSQNSVKELELDVPRRCIAQEIDGAIVYAPNGKKIVVEFEKSKGYILERKIFDKWLAQEAAKAGAKVIAKSNVSDIIKNNGFVSGVKANIIGDGLEIKSKVVVAADGVESLVMRKAGMQSQKNPRFVDSGFQYEMEDIEMEDPNKIILYFGNKIAPRGYCWIFPKGETRANVGIGISGLEEKTAKYYLDNWIETREEIKKGSILEVNGGCIPVGNFMENMVGNGLVGVGDSVNQVNPIHGGGMAESMRAGRIAGNVISKAIKNNDLSEKALSEYNIIWWKERGERLKRIERVREMFEKMSDEELNDIAEVLSGEDLTDFARGKITKLVKIYAKFKAKAIKRRIWK